jgi:hypothetical protein
MSIIILTSDVKVRISNQSPIPAPTRKLLEVIEEAPLPIMWRI